MYLVFYIAKCYYMSLLVPLALHNRQVLNLSFFNLMIQVLQNMWYIYMCVFVYIS